ncbi:MAG: GAF domain-containing protein [Eubacteriales bacterium]|nr:GAF domain-containing protein [Eubacteriales bacterium]
MIIDMFESLIDESSPTVSNLANAASFLYNELTDISWVGFYILKNQTLYLGPFMGKPACLRIALGKGVCGTCAESKQIQIVPNVHKFPGHIACDSASNAEIVLPIIIDEKVVAVLDIDSASFNRFNDNDALLLQKVCEILQHKCSWSNLC